MLVLPFGFIETLDAFKFSCAGTMCRFEKHLCIMIGLHFDIPLVCEFKFSSKSAPIEALIYAYANTITSPAPTSPVYPSAFTSEFFLQGNS